MSPRNTMKLRLNPIACRAHGLCAELLPEIIDLDEWGYPIINPDTVPRSLLDEAHEAVASCPTLALQLDRARL